MRIQSSGLMQPSGADTRDNCCRFNHPWLTTGRRRPKPACELWLPPPHPPSDPFPQKTGRRDRTMQTTSVVRVGRERAGPRPRWQTVPGGGGGLKRGLWRGRDGLLWRASQDLVVAAEGGGWRWGWGAGGHAKPRSNGLARSGALCPRPSGTAQMPHELFIGWRRP